ncbi:Glycerol kinase [Aquisphaera giovannonii]|uniref:Glycerol kinase n=1 Tax=Aquisphaera giovannonii TaxID=406548 RepID=A0A5B9WAW1_9BACT|nr:glycerol kinase GlpK [Aquisphaera giovannonii]QEH37151.1 Glycerol kinase [Aquisphaera giovannonii]
MLILALDQGTTSSRAILFDEAGAVRGVAQREFRQIYPKPGWVEHDPSEIWSSQIGVAAEVLGRCEVGPRDVAAIGITNQRETTIVWDRASGHPIHNAIVWQDRRTAPLMDRMKADGSEALLRERTGLVADPYFSASKVRWILDAVPGARQRAERGELAFGTVDSWLVSRLTGGKLHATDATNASRTLLFNIHTRQWDDELLGLFGVPRAMLPEVRDSSHVYGEVTADLAPGNVPIAGIAGDQHAALFGQQCRRGGMLKNTYGTGCFMLMNTEGDAIASSRGLITTPAWSLGGKLTYALEGSVFVAGAAVQWLRDGLGLIESASDIEPLADSVEDAGGVYLVPAFTGLGAPYWDPHARGVLVGLSRGASRAHLARAVLESIAHQSADLAEAMEADAGLGPRTLRVDGGASCNNLLMQIQADLLQAPVERPVVTETTALGAAFLAGLAVGFWKDDDELAGSWTLDRRFEPRMSPGHAAEQRRQWRRAVERAKGWAEADSAGTVPA